MPIINPNVCLPEDEKDMKTQQLCLCEGLQVNDYTICAHGNMLCSASRLAVKYTLDGLPYAEIEKKTIEGLKQIYS